ncbi:MAG: glycosyltransferase [Pirellulaceae bacterium]|nr:glycosyltransferase [Pirellulaceae bacterium]
MSGDSPTLPRLLIVAGSLVGGGYQRQLYYLVRELSQLGCDVEVAVWRYRKDDVYVAPIRELGITVSDVNSRFGMPGRIVRLIATARRFRPTLIQSFCFISNFPVWLAAKLVGVHAIGGIRSDFQRELANVDRVRGFLSARFPRVLIANSLNANRQFDQSRFGAGGGICHYVGNAIDLELFSGSASQAEMPLRFLAVGRLVASKIGAT